jgi:hypothetical protein
MALTRKLARGGSSGSAPIAVADNDAKQLLTNLSDGQEVEVVGEGGRIERFNGDSEGIAAINFGGSLLITGGTYEIGAGVQDFASGGSAGELVQMTNGELGSFRSTGSEYITVNSLSYILTGDASAGVSGTANKWGIYDQFYAGNTFWESTEDSSTCHPADATWVIVHPDAKTIPIFTRVPEAVQENWQVLKNTVYLTVVNAIANAFDFNKIAVGSSATQGIGWVPVGERILSDESYRYNIVSVDGVTAYTLSTNDMEIVSAGNSITLPDIFPHAAIVRITNA